MASTEIHLNRRGINSIEAPPAAEVPAGKSLVLVLVNHGHPLHLSVSASNAARFTPFMQQNLFVQGEGSLSIPVKGDAPAGTFDLEVMTGYGMRKVVLQVTVIPAALVKAPEEKAPPPAPVRSPLALHRAAPPLLAAGVLLYAAWWILKKPETLSVLSFLALLSAAILAWRRPPSS
ncbi:MAG: hypothetical protein LUQ62_05735 [Methanomicrobiales archaeon]|nr:hypothetical protein [Methanomicrobiales archaeon]